MNSGKIVVDGTGGEIEGSTRGPPGPKKMENLSNGWKWENLVERSLVISGSSGGRWVGCKNLYLGHSETTLGTLRKELGGKEKKCQKRHWCQIAQSVYGHLQSTIESQDYGATKRGISMHDTSLCCKDSPSKVVLCHTWSDFHAWHVTLLQGQPIKIWIFGGKASSAQGLNTKPIEHIESKVIWDPPYYFFLLCAPGLEEVFGFLADQWLYRVPIWLSNSKWVGEPD